MREESTWWIEDAKRCLTKAGKYLELGFYEDYVFNCQQALEKLFKDLSIEPFISRWRNTSSQY